MKQCTECEAKFGDHYNKCPGCNSLEIVPALAKYQAKAEEVKEPSKLELALAVNGDIDDIN